MAGCIVLSILVNIMLILGGLNTLTNIIMTVFPPTNTPSEESECSDPKELVIERRFFYKS